MTVRKIKSIGDVPYPIDVGADALSPLLTAGAALGITGDGPTESAAWLQRTSTGDGPTTVKGIHGRTLRWNQLFTPYARTATTSGVTYTYGADGKVTLTGTATETNSFTLNRTGSFAVVAGHKYMVKGGSSSAGVSISVTGLTGSTYEGIYTCSASGSGYSTIRFASTFSGTYEGYPQLFDLTAMFGAGSEPSTVAEFEALYNADYYPYDAGSLLPVNMTGIETEDANGDPLQTRTIPAGTLRGAGSVYDELTKTERITRVGEVDLGTLTWTRINSGDVYIFQAGISAMIQNGRTTDLSCSGYTVMNSSGFGLADKCCARATGSKTVYVRDDAYTDAAAFKTAMSGVMLHYALATPTTTTFDQPLNMTYRTETGGTERVMVPTGELSAPPAIVTAQGYTAESLRDAALATIAPVENGTASTNYGVGSYLIHGGQLCKVTTAIATGEAITIGTNVTTTTVMAEVLSLTQ